MTPELREGILSNGETLPTKRAPNCFQAEQDPSSLDAVATVFTKLERGARTVSTYPIALALRPDYPVNEQQDCHDTWMLLCDKLEADLKESAQPRLVNDLFEGKQLDYVRCHACGTVTKRPDTFVDLALAVPSPPPPAEGSATVQMPSPFQAEKPAMGSFWWRRRLFKRAAPAAEPVPAAQPAPATPVQPATSGGGAAAEQDAQTPPPPPPPQTVVGALRELLKPEQLNGAEQYVCDKCECKRDAERGVALTRLPPLLTLHLKRFTGQLSARGDEMRFVKVNTPVRFERSLDLRPLLGESALPGLRATPTASTDAAPSSSSTSDTPGTTAATAASTATPAADASEGTGASAEGSGAAAEGAAPVAAAGRSSSQQYELYAVLVHAGSFEKGHYYALIRAPPGDAPANSAAEEGAWYRFDDEKVRRLSAEERELEMEKAYGGGLGLAQCAAYMLMYREVEGKAAGGPAGGAEEGTERRASPSLAAAQEGAREGSTVAGARAEARAGAPGGVEAGGEASGAPAPAADAQLV